MALEQTTYRYEHFERERLKYIREKGVVTVEETEAATKEFLEVYEQNAKMGLYDNDACSYMEKFEDADRFSDKVRYARKALELDPSLIEIRAFLIWVENQDNLDACIEKFKELIREEEKRIRDLEEGAGEKAALEEENK